jgi:uncharacterized protein YndB with AHSA1/START domain
MRPSVCALPLLLSMVAMPARAEVKQVAADAFLVQHSRVLHAAPARVYAALVDIAHWWDGVHTWSGDAAHLRLDAHAGGCFCERWDGNSVQHMRVLWASPGQMLRMEGAIGPLQEMAVAGVMTFALKPDGKDTRLEFSYRVTGAGSSRLDRIAPMVDRVLGGQLDRLQRYVQTGRAAAPGP